MTPNHPTPALFDQLLAGALPPTAARPPVLHLLQGCTICLAHLHGAGPDATSHPAPRPPANLNTPAVSPSPTPIPQATRNRLAPHPHDPVEATALWAILRATPAARRPPLVARDPRFHSWPLAERCLETAAELSWQDPPRGLRYCHLALAIADRLPAATYPAALRHDLRARALAALADALRLDHQPAAARATLRQARAALRQGTRDPLERAHLLRLAAALETTAGLPDRAVALLRTAADLFHHHHDPHEEARTVYHLACAVGHDNPCQGVALACQALTLLAPGAEPLLDLALRHQLAWFVNDCDLPDFAHDLLERLRPAYAQFADTEPHLLRPWLEARICRRFGRLPAAERGLAATWHRLRQAGCPRELTLVTLDLAETYLAQHKTRHAQRLLGAFRHRLLLWGAQPATHAAWHTLLTAAAGDPTAAQALARETALDLRRTWPQALQPPFPRPAEAP